MRLLHGEGHVLGERGDLLVVALWQARGLARAADDVAEVVAIRHEFLGDEVRAVASPAP